MAEKTVKLEDPANNRMGSAKMLPLILTMALPAMFSMLIQALYNIVDSYFVAQVSQNALTAVSLAFPIQNLLVAFGVGTGVGVSSLISRRLGERDQEAADNARHYSFCDHVCGLCNFRCDCGASVYGALHAGRGSAQHGHDVHHDCDGSIVRLLLCGGH